MNITSTDRARYRRQLFETLETSWLDQQSLDARELMADEKRTLLGTDDKVTDEELTAWCDEHGVPYTRWKKQGRHDWIVTVRFGDVRKVVGHQDFRSPNCGAFSPRARRFG